MKNPSFEAVKEALRYAVFYALSTFISVLADKVASIKTEEIWVLLLALALRTIDKYLHEKNKERSPLKESKPSGLLPF